MSNSYAQLISLSTENGSQSIMCKCMYFVQCSNMMRRGRVGGKGEGHYGNWERRAGGWGDATST